MTLSGLALAIGILVDQATVALENIHTHLARGKAPARAVLDGMGEIMQPQLLAMLCILAVLIPALFMVGIGKALFPPLALAVGFSMIASYLLSSTVVPVLAARLLRSRSPGGDGDGEGEGVRRGPVARLHEAYGRLAERIVRHRRIALFAYALLCVPALLVARQLGSELFPRTDADQFQLRIRAPAGTRLERTEEIVLGVERTIRAELGEGTVALTLANVGNAPWSYPVNALYVFNSGPHEALLLVALDPRAHRRRPSIPAIEESLRSTLRKRFPQVTFSFEPGDIVSQVLAFGAAAPIQVTVSGSHLGEIATYARKVKRALAAIPELRDVQIPQSLDYPTLDVTVDRERAGELGLTTDRVVRSVINATSSSVLTTPIFWTDPKSGVPYRVAVRVPESELSSDNDLLQLPVMRDGSSRALLRDVATVQPGTTPGEVDRINGRRTVSVTANVFGSDLGRAADAVERALKSVGEPPRGVSIEVRGQAALMRSTLESLRAGLVLSALVVFLLLAASFQSLREPAMVLLVLPAVLAGVVLALGATGTTLNVQSLMGAIMSIGVSVANAVLLLSLARERRLKGDDPMTAAVAAARGRMRPIVMTAMAMIVGMLPTALAIGEGAEQSAPLGRAVIGGLVTSTIATLVFLPAIYAALAERKLRVRSLHPDDRGDAASRALEARS
jgi:multidrug efflux pump subunit AcrB